MATAVALPLLVGGCSKKDEPAAAPAATAAPAVNQGITISIDKYKFDPVDAKAKIGELVTWENLQGISHTVTEEVADDKRIIKSEPMLQGQKYSLSFPTAGTYKYICSVHPTEMSGTITVA